MLLPPIPVPLFPLALFALDPVPVGFTFAEFNDPFDQLKNNHGSGGHKIVVTPGRMVKIQTAPLIVGFPTHHAEAAAEALDFKVFLQFRGCPCVTRLRCAIQ